MNKILVTARKAKGVSEEQIASVLGITALDYGHLESHQQVVTPPLARMLADYFSVPAYYFLDTSKTLDISARIDLLKKHHEVLNKPEQRGMSAGDSLALVTTTIELMIAKEEVAHSLVRELELSEDLAALTTINEHLNELLKKQSSTRK